MEENLLGPSEKEQGTQMMVRHVDPDVTGESTKQLKDKLTFNSEGQENADELATTGAGQNGWLKSEKITIGVQLLPWCR